MNEMKMMVSVPSSNMTSAAERNRNVSDKRTLLRNWVVDLMILLIAAVSAVGVPQQIAPLVSVSMGVIRCVLVALHLRPFAGRGARKPDLSPACRPFSFPQRAWNFWAIRSSTPSSSASSAARQRM
jgi:hypothetical protein